MKKDHHLWVGRRRPVHRDDGKKWSRGTLGEGVSSDQGKSGFRKEGAVRSHKCPERVL